MKAISHLGTNTFCLPAILALVTSNALISVLSCPSCAKLHCRTQGINCCSPCSASCTFATFAFSVLQMQHIQANSHLLCNSCDKELGFIRRNVNVAQFLYCDECVKAQKFHPYHAFLQTWDKDIFLPNFTDFSLEGSDGGILRAHKAVLAGKSKVFKAMLSAGMSESVTGKAKIADMTAKELHPLINFLYTGRVNQRSLECHGVALYRASVKYDLPLLTAICERFLESNVFRDIPGVFELAVDHEVQKFQEAVLPFIFSEGFVESNPPALVLKTLRAASKFECFVEYRKKNFKAVSFLMELTLYRMADHLDDPHKGVEELNEVVSNLRTHYKDDQLDVIEQEVVASMDTLS